MTNSIHNLIDSLLCEIYGDTKTSSDDRNAKKNPSKFNYINKFQSIENQNSAWKYSQDMLKIQSLDTLIEITSCLQMEIRIIGMYLIRNLKSRDRMLRKRELLCDNITYQLKSLSLHWGEENAMKFGLIPPISSSSNESSTSKSSIMGISNTSSDFKQWLHAMKMVARLPGGMPPEFRRKLWLALAERHLETKRIDWNEEEKKCLCDQWRDDDEELGIQIVKDLHRTGSSLFSGPAGSLNQAKLKRVLLGYARFNPEVGYCQGFNMLGALILQVMDKSEVESLKVMIYLIEGILPAGYFCGSLGGLQADMAVFRDILSTRLPKLAKHLDKLQGPLGEGCFEPPLINVFTMQWFLTLFCTCLPINCVLRVWDLVLIEGSDVLLRTALAIWGLLEKRIFAIKSADDFYCKMGTLSGELLNGHLFDSNGLIQKIVDLGPITDLQKMRDKHLYNIAPWRDKRGLRLFYSDEEAESDEDSRIAVSTAWGLRLGRRGSAGLQTQPNQTIKVTSGECKDKIALDISLLKQQYSRLRERQKQAHIILTTSARQSINLPSSSVATVPVNQLLMGRNAIVNKGRRIGPPAGAIPPVRKSASNNKIAKQLKRGETLHWKDTDSMAKRKVYTELVDKKGESITTTADNLKSNLTRSPSTTSLNSDVAIELATTSTATGGGSSKCRHKSESSSYSEDESDGNSSTSTSLCDDENLDFTASSIEGSPLKKLMISENVYDECIDEPSTSHIDECRLTFEKFNQLNMDDVDADLTSPIENSSDNNKPALLADIADDETNQFDIAITSNTDTNLDKINDETTHFDMAFKSDMFQETTKEFNEFKNLIDAIDKSAFPENETFEKYSLKNNKKEIDDILIKIDTIVQSRRNSMHSEYPNDDNFAYERFRNADSPEGISSDIDNNLQSIKHLIFDNSTTTVDHIVDSPPNKDQPPTFKLNDLLNDPIISSTSINSTLNDKAPSQLSTPISLPPPPEITSTIQLSPIGDFSKYLSSSSIISPLRTPPAIITTTTTTTTTTALPTSSSSSPTFLKYSSISGSDIDNNITEENEINNTANHKTLIYQVSDEGVTNEYFERVNNDRPNRLELIESYNNNNTIDNNINENRINPVEINDQNRTDNENENNLYKSLRTKEDIEFMKTFALSPPTIYFDELNKLSEDNPLTSSSFIKNHPNISNNDLLASSANITTADINNDRTQFFKEKSFSLDIEPTRNRKDFRPTSCPESRENYSGKNNTDRILKMIEENSMILHRILKKNVDELVVADREIIKKGESILKDTVIPYQDNLQPVTKIDTQVGDSSIPTNSNDLIKTNEQEDNNLIQFEDIHTTVNSIVTTTTISPIAATSRTVPTKSNNTKINSSTTTTSTTSSTTTSTTNSSSRVSSITTTAAAAVPTTAKTTSNYDDNISATLSSIQNTIKSIDYLCQDDQRKSRSRLEKTMEYINKNYDNKIDDNKIKKFNCQNKLAKLPDFRIDNTKSVTAVNVQIDDVDKNSKMLSSRVSRDRKRDFSPRRRRDEDKEEYESRIRRDLSPNFLNKYYDYDTEKSFKDFYTLDSDDKNLLNFNDSNIDVYNKSIPIIDNNINVSDNKLISATDEYKLKNVGIKTNHDEQLDAKDLRYGDGIKRHYPMEKLEIRQTTVTATMYDRFLSQKMERNSKIDKLSSPTSPIITRSYLESLKPQPSSSSSSSLSSLFDRNSRSAENSPSRYNSNSNNNNNNNNNVIIHSTSNNADKQFSIDKSSNLEFDTKYNKYINFSADVRSCDNIPANLQLTKNNKDTFIPYSPLPRKTKKPPELGIKLGMYK